jgi:hypothetical protein
LTLFFQETETKESWTTAQNRLTSLFKGYVDAVLAIWNSKTQKKYI